MNDDTTLKLVTNVEEYQQLIAKLQELLGQLENFQFEFSVKQ